MKKLEKKEILIDDIVLCKEESSELMKVVTDGKISLDTAIKINLYQEKCIKTIEGRVSDLNYRDHGDLILALEATHSRVFMEMEMTAALNRTTNDMASVEKDLNIIGNYSLVYPMITSKEATTWDTYYKNLEKPSDGGISWSFVLLMGFLIFLAWKYYKNSQNQEDIKKTDVVEEKV